MVSSTLEAFMAKTMAFTWRLGYEMEAQVHRLKCPASFALYVKYKKPSVDG